MIMEKSESQVLNSNLCFTSCVTRGQVSSISLSLCEKDGVPAASLIV